MPRAPWNTEAVFTYGPCHPWAGDPAYIGPARWVPADGIFLTGSIVPNVVGWLTYGTVASTGMWVPTKLGVNPNLSDRVRWGSEMSPTHWTVWTERVLWKGANYFRSSLAPLPVPTFVDCGEITTSCNSGSGSGPPPIPTGPRQWHLIGIEDGECTDTLSWYVQSMYEDSPGIWRRDQVACAGLHFDCTLTISIFGITFHITGPLGTNVYYSASGPWVSGMTLYLGSQVGSAYVFPATMTID